MRKYLLIFSLFLFSAGCGVQEEDWELLDAVDFTILAPADWEFIPGMGTDSKVGTFTNGEMTLRFDYGAYVGDFSNNSLYFEDPSAYTLTEETLAVFKVKIYLPTDESGSKPSVFYIENPRGPRPCTEGSCFYDDEENFEMIGENLDEKERDLALQIFRTIDFK